MKEKCACFVICIVWCDFVHIALLGEKQRLLTFIIKLVMKNPK